MENIYIYILCRTVFGLLSKLYCEKENFCIARRALYCDIVALDVQERWIVLQHKVCIATKVAGRWPVQGKIVLQEGQVYCNRGSLTAEETVLQYSLVGSRFVLQYKLYCELRVGCVTTRRWAKALGAGRAGRRSGVGEQGAQGGRRSGQQARGRCRGVVRVAMHGLGVLLGQQAVHSVHSACFDLVSTQYCS